MDWAAEVYRRYVHELADPRNNDRFLMRSPWPTLLILAGYFVLVLDWGPRFMASREPFSCRHFMLGYNVFQIIGNAFLVGYYLSGGWLDDYGLGCEPVRYDRRPQSLRMAHAAYLTFLLKTLDLSETVVFVLRKKPQQVTFLHLYHHASTALISQLCAKFAPGGMISMLMLVNGSVHVLMYSYYLLASLSDSRRPSRLLRNLKVYVTRVQIAQFVFLVLHQAQALLPSCPMSKAIPAIIVGDLLVNFGLFCRFYSRTYGRAQDKSLAARGGTKSRDKEHLN